MILLWKKHKVNKLSNKTIYNKINLIRNRRMTRQDKAKDSNNKIYRSSNRNNNKYRSNNNKINRKYNQSNNNLVPNNSRQISNPSSHQSLPVISGSMRHMCLPINWEYCSFITDIWVRVHVLCLLVSAASTIWIMRWVWHIF